MACKASFMSSNRRPHRPLAGFVTLLILAAAALPAMAADITLPDSLAQWYKPANKRQVWLHTMFAMRRELQATREYLQQEDGEHALKWANRLAEHYARMPEMVPEWRDEYDMASIDALIEKTAARDFDAALRASDEVTRDCRSCHRQYQALTALKFRWPDFREQRVVLDDGSERAYDEHMALLSTTLNRIRIASDDERWSDATRSLDALREQLGTLGKGCASCHDDAAPRERILGAETEQTFDQLAQSLTAADGKRSGRLLGEAAVAVCARCHGTHRLLSDMRRQLFD